MQTKVQTTVSDKNKTKQRKTKQTETKKNQTKTRNQS